MRKSLLFSTTALIVLAAATAASADDTAETVVVTATRVPTPESQVASSMTVITADDIAAKGLITLPDVLADVPGLNIVQTGGAGGQTSVFMRGTNSNHVKVLVDGIDVSDVSNPNDSFDFGQFLTPDIARIEILRGPQSGLYGSDAIGGVINIITKSGEGPAQFTAGVEGGSFDTFNQTGGVSGSEGGFHYVADIEHFHSGATPVTPLALLTPGEPRNDDRYDNVTASTKLGYDVSDNFDLGFVGRYTNSQRYFTGDNYNPYPAIPDTTQSKGSVVEYFTRATAHIVLFDGFFEQTAGLAYSTTSSNDVSPDSSSPSPYAGDRIKADWQGNLKFSDSEILVLGAEHERDEIRVPLSAGIDINSGYAELQSTLFENFFNALSLRYDSNDHFGDKLTFREAPGYVIAATGTTLKGSIGTGFKAPTLNELFENFPGFSADPKLRPESSIGYDAGFEQPLFANQAQFGATYFHNNIKNLIDDNANFTSYANIDTARTHGIEAYVAYQPIQSVNLRADYTYTEVTGIDTGLGLYNQELSRRPKNKLSVDAKWQATGALSFDADVLYVSSWEDIGRETFSYLKQPGYTTANVAVNYDINNEFTAYGRVSNLFDEHYQDPNGFLRPGRGFFAGIKAKI